jgi:hypothetical protein
MQMVGMIFYVKIMLMDPHGCNFQTFIECNLRTVETILVLAHFHFPADISAFSWGKTLLSLKFVVSVILAWLLVLLVCVRLLRENNAHGSAWMQFPNIHRMQPANCGNYSSVSPFSTTWIEHTSKIWKSSYPPRIRMIYSLQNHRQNWFDKTYKGNWISIFYWYALSML